MAKVNLNIERIVFIIFRIISMVLLAWFLYLFLIG